jgi:hypothetical protein
MTISAATNEGAGIGPARGAAGWLAIAASPTFALMALFSVHDAHRIALCSSGSNLLPVDGMTAMYLLMSLFHLPPWLKLVSTARRAPHQ